MDGLQLNEIDPSEDRGEFKRRLDDIFRFRSELDIDEAFRALITDDYAKIAQMAAQIKAAQARVDEYLVRWDAAESKEDKRRIVESVSVNP